MTLIAGVRGIRKSFIVADSRATVTRSDGSVLIEDNAQKWMIVNPLALVAVAGDAHLGSYIASELSDMCNDNMSFSEVKKVFDDNIRNVSIKFNRITGKFCACAIIIVGYDTTQRDSFDSSRLGSIMSAGVLSKKDERLVPQSVDSEIIKAMSNALRENDNYLPPNTQVPVGLAKSIVAGYKVKVSHDDVIIDSEEADNFGAIFYGEDADFNKIILPDEILSRIYLKDASGMSDFNIISRDTIEIISFYKSIIADRKYKGVGGGIFPVMMTENGGYYFSDDIDGFSLVDGSKKSLRSSVEISGKMHYRDKDGTPIPYKTIPDIAKETNSSDYVAGYSLIY